MRRKWNGGGGFTLVETLCAAAILSLLCLTLGAGMQAAMETYRTITARSETQLLLNTLVDAIADELRYAQEVVIDGEGRLEAYNGGRALALDANGQVLAGGNCLLPTEKEGRGGAYHGGNYRAEGLEIKYEQDTACFTLSLKVVWKEGNIVAETPEGGVVIRCLNPPEETAETPPEGG